MRFANAGGSVGFAAAGGADFLPADRVVVFLGAGVVPWAGAGGSGCFAVFFLAAISPPHAGIAYRVVCPPGSGYGRRARGAGYLPDFCTPRTPARRRTVTDTLGRDPG
jgi:hypothetical protein